MKKFLFVGLMFVSSLAFSQCFFGVSAGISNYYGDLSKSISPFSSGSARGALGIEYGKAINNKWDFIAGFNMAGLAGDDVASTRLEQVQRGYEFKSLLLEFQGLLNLELFSIELEGGSKLTAGTSTGLSLIYFNPVHADPALSAMALQMEDYNNFGLAIPVNLYLGLESSGVVYFTQLDTRYVFTDYLDGLSELVNPNGRDSFGFFRFGARIPMQNLIGKDCL